MYKLRRIMMYILGNNLGMIKDGYIYGVDLIMFDLEDLVLLNEKDVVRFLVYNVLKIIDYEGVEIVVRINGLDICGMEDLEVIVRV